MHSILSVNPSEAGFKTSGNEVTDCEAAIHSIGCVSIQSTRIHSLQICSFRRRRIHYSSALYTCLSNEVCIHVRAYANVCACMHVFSNVCLSVPCGSIRVYVCALFIYACMYVCK